MTSSNNLTNSIVYNLLKIGSRLHKTGDAIAAEYRLNQQQFVVLNKIANRKTLIQKDIISDLLLNKPHVSKILKKLKQLGYIETSESPTDKRSTIIRITKTGQTVHKKCLEDFNRWNENWLEGLTGPQLEQIHQSLHMLLNIDERNP